MCKKTNCCFLTAQQNLKSSLWDTGLRLDGLSALEFWDLIVSVLGNVSRISDRSGQPDNDVHKRHKSQKKNRCDRRTLMLFFQMSNPRVKKLYCMCLRTMKQ